jgi:hypothetical protein
MTPDQVHYGQADQVHAARQITLDGAFRTLRQKGARTTGKSDRDLDQSTEPPANEPGT